jgi:pyruvate formate lyase activating enzyme
MEHLFRVLDGRKIECLICPHNCKIAEGKTGICGVRKNTGDRIDLLTYGVVSGISLDPMEKKPLYHFFPGSKILSIGSWGCNMKCDFCQNYHISQNVDIHPDERIDIKRIIEKALREAQNSGIAFTYNEPVIWYEFVRDVSMAAKAAGLHTVMVTNGFVNENILYHFLGFIDAFNVDLKSFRNDFYRNISGAELEPVKKTLKIIAASGRHLEITTLVIPGLNDSVTDFEQEVKWIADEVGKDVPFHISRYFPMYKRSTPSTLLEALKGYYEIAVKHLHYVYVGNISSDYGQDTRCPGCGAIITRRTGYSTEYLNTGDGKCSVCGTVIYRNFTSFSSWKQR